MSAQSDVMRRVAIMQPTHLPYLGYFELIAQSDLFVFLDDVQFERRSWQSRNRIMTASGELMLTVPVKKHDRDSALGLIELSEDQPWREKHLASVRHAYGARPHFTEMFGFLEAELARKGMLADLTAGLIEAAARKLEIETQAVRASTLGSEGRRSDHLLAICKAVGATEYLSTTGSREYLEADGVFAAAGMPVRYFSHQPKPYPQGRAEFAPYMAFIDAVANVGWDGTRALLDVDG